MDTQGCIEWLLAEGGPVVRYRTALELLDNQVGDDARNLIDAVVQTDRVQRLLGQMDCFPPIDHLDIGVLNSLHGMKTTCLENVIARLLELGLRAGVKVFDQRMDRFRQSGL